MDNVIPSPEPVVKKVTRRTKIPFAYEADNKEFIKLYKLYFSSLFMRKQDNVYLNKAKPHEAYFTSVSPETLLINKPDYTGSFHKVIACPSIDFIKMISVYIDLSEYKSQYLCVDITIVNKLITRSNKEKKSIKELGIIETHKIPNTVSYETTRKIHKVDTLVDVPIVYFTSEVYSIYISDTIQTVEDWVRTAPVHSRLPISTAGIIKGDVNYFTIKELINEGCVLFGEGINLPFSDGHNTVATNEYIKKLKGDKHNTLMVAGQKGNVLRYYFEHNNELLNVVSVCPATFLLCRKQII